MSFILRPVADYFASGRVFEFSGDVAAPVIQENVEIIKDKFGVPHIYGGEPSFPVLGISY
jgi:acyl-homoserine lactone acylase PvdQ